jgi:para-nitrobenzyl esterase
MIGFTAYEMGFYLLADDDFDRRSVDQVAELIPFVPALARDRLPALYRHWFPDATDGQRGMHLLSDAVFAIPALWFAELASANGASVYAYRFDWAVDARVGAVHAADVAFMLGVEDTSDAALLIGHPSTAENRTQRRNLAEQMTGAVASFAANGAPTVQGRQWPAYAADRRQMMLFDVSPRTAEDPIHERREWWTANVLPTAFGGGAR